MARQWGRTGLTIGIVLLAGTSRAGDLLPSSEDKAQATFEVLKKRLPVIVIAWAQANDLSVSPENVVKVARRTGDTEAKITLAIGEGEKVDRLVIIHLRYYDGLWTTIRSEASGPFFGGVGASEREDPVHYLALAIDRSHKTWPDEAEVMAAEAIKKVGGKPWRDAGVDSMPVRSLRLDGEQCTDAVLVNVAAFKQLQILDLDGTKVSDAGLKELAHLPQLRELGLRSTKVTDAGLKDLAALKQLQSLSLSDTQVTDAGLKDLARAQATPDAVPLRHQGDGRRRCRTPKGTAET